MEIPEVIRPLILAAKDLGFRLFLVGGAVRDLLLGLKTIDFDLLVDGSALDLAQALAGLEGFSLVSLHKPFGTAKILCNGHPVDLASPRTESYSQPGALPVVQYPVPVSEDLLRRDFRCNAIAVELTSSGFGQWVDPHAGRQDLADRKLAVLHPLSYLEDPTRIIRAARFATRLGFTLADRERKLIAAALTDERVQGMVYRLRGVRLGIELRRLLELESWLEGAQLANDLGAFSLFGLAKLNIPETCSLQSKDWLLRFAWLLKANGQSALESLPELVKAFQIPKSEREKLFRVNLEALEKI